MAHQINNCLATSSDNSNLTIPYMRELFGCGTGLPGYTLCVGSNFLMPPCDGATPGRD